MPVQRVPADSPVSVVSSCGNYCIDCVGHAWLLFSGVTSSLSLKETEDLYNNTGPLPIGMIGNCRTMTMYLMAVRGKFLIN